MTALKWESEAAMCSAFQARAAACGFAVHPEDGGADIVLVAPDDCERRGLSGLEPGDTIAVQAKLRGSLEVLAQALPAARARYPRLGAAHDWYAVLVPGSAEGFRAIAEALGILAWNYASDEPALWRAWRGEPGPVWPWPWPPSARQWDHTRVRLGPAVDMAGGCPAPRTVTHWKVEAVKLCLRGEPLRRRDFVAAGVDPRLFIERGWVRVVGQEGRIRIYEIVPGSGHPAELYPEVAAAVQRAAP